MGGSSRSLYTFIRRLIRHYSNYRGMPLLSTSNKILLNFLLSRSMPYTEKLLWIIIVDFEAEGHILIIYSAFVNYLRKNGNKMKHYIKYLYTSRELMI